MDPIVDIDKAVEAICIAAMRLTRVAVAPAFVKRTLIADVVDKKSNAPSCYECEMLVEAATERLEPEWFGARWPRTLGMVTMVIHGT